MKQEKLLKTLNNTMTIEKIRKYYLSLKRITLHFMNLPNKLQNKREVVLCGQKL